VSEQPGAARHETRHETRHEPLGEPLHEPLGQVTSIKVKLGLLVAASVLVAAVLATLGAGAVPAWLSIPVTVLLALAVTQLLAVGMTSPLRQMTEAARRMAAGDYAVRVQTASTDEVGQLARAFNTMSADLATVDRQRRDLVASVSHELRTPLAALVAVLENIDDGVTAPDPDTVHVARAQAERLSDLVDDLLDLSRVDAGVVSLDRVDQPVGPVVEAAVAEARSGPGASRRGVGFDVRVDPTDLTAYADRARLRQLLANLLDNAARHSPAGGVVHVSAQGVDGILRLEVADQGPGIAPQDRERVFEKFGTLPGSGGGTGLGLAIARWVTDLHGGRIAVVDPVPGESGARFRVDLPRTSSSMPPERNLPMATQPPAPAAAPVVPPLTPRTSSSGSMIDDLFGRLWTDRGVPARRWVLLVCLAIGLFAGWTLPDTELGLAASLVLVASGVLVLVLTRHRRSPFTWACAALAFGFALLPTLRDADWLAVLGLMASVVLVTAALTAGTSVLGMVTGAMAWPLAGLRGMPWLGRILRSFTRGSHTAAVTRTIVLSVLGVLVFGLLFASADAIVGHWLDALLPDVQDMLAVRLFVTVAVGGIVLAAAYLAINPPDVERPVVRRPAQHRFEWLAPVLLVDAVFVLFLAAQAAAFFGGHDYIQRTTGLTYAEYVHQGFAQLTIATLLTLLVVWAAARKARLGAPGDRAWLRVSLGALCLLTLVVVASALHRMDLYQDAYGFTRLRLVVDLFEGWLGLVVLAVIAAGIGLSGRWLPRFALLSGATLLLGLAVANPDAWIARHNVERYQATGKVDWAYLAGLSADATPELAKLPHDEAACALATASREPDSWTEWNLARARARDALAGIDTGTAACPSPAVPGSSSSEP
jgi:two-component system sensor histidine kinase BaeS